MTRICTVDLTLDVTAPRSARALLRDALRSWGVADETLHDTAQIIVTELVTNALVHGLDAGPVTVLYELQDQRLLISVVDRRPELPVQRTASPGDENGRGLAIVETLSLRWGSEPWPGGKRVFAELAAGHDRELSGA